MPKKLTKAQQHDLVALRLRDVVLRCYAEAPRRDCSPWHRTPGWDELPYFDRATWTAIAAALVAAGWRPPAGGT